MKQQIVVSHSRVKSWRTCRMRHWYRYVEKLRRKRPAVPLIRGRMIGESLDAFAEGKTHEAVLKKYEKEYRRLFDEERDQYGTIIQDVDQIVTGYREIYGKEKYLKNPEGKPYEYPIRIEFAGGTVFVGYIDKLLVDKKGDVWVMDHKSHKSIPDEDTRFADLQTVFYYWGVKLDSTMHISPRGVVWDYLRTKPPAVPDVLKNGELSRRQNIDTTWKVYQQAILANGLKEKDYADMKKLLTGNEASFYRRVTLPGPNDSLVNFVVEDMKQTADEIRDFGAKRGPGTIRCMTRDCKQCEFYLLCQTEVRGLDANFVRKHDYFIKESDDHGDQKEVPVE